MQLETYIENVLTEALDFASSPIILVFHDAMSSGIMLCISFMTWAMGLCFYDSALRIRQIRIEDKIIARYKNNG